MLTRINTPRIQKQYNQMAPTQKVTKPQGTPTKKSRAMTTTEHGDQDLLFLWAYFKQAELPAVSILRKIVDLPYLT